MSYLFPRSRILVFSKPPLPGKCKTRLIPYLGEQGAARLQENLIKKIIADLVTFKLCPIEIWQSEQTDYFTSHYKTHKEIAIYTQDGIDLGVRMENAIQESLKRAERIILIGSDCVLYSKSYLSIALKTLGNNQVVLGPAKDGGYVLIGVKQIHPTLFSNIEWGSDNVLDITVHKIQEANLEFELLSELWDIDTESDIELLKKMSPEILL